MDDFASEPRPVSRSSFALSCTFTSPNGISGDAQASPPSSAFTCRARNVPAGTVTDSQPTTWAMLQRAAHSAANLLYPTRSASMARSEEHTSELQSLAYLVCRL